MRTTLTLDDDVFAKLQQQARCAGLSFKEAVNQTLRQGLLTRPEPPRQPYRVQARSLGLRPGYSLDNIGELLERMDGEGKHL